MKISDLGPALEDLRNSHRLRTPDDSLERTRLQNAFGEDFLDAATNDYLGLAMGVGDAQREDVPRETSLPFRGAGASRLIFGTHQEHVQVEADVAAWLGLPSALLFASGYAANVGALQALLSKDDLVFSDQLNHASLIDGMRLAGVRPKILPHLDLAALEHGLREAPSAPARWVVVEAYYSMDGDGPDLRRLRDLCLAYDAALYVDEAHSIGTFGPAGAGLCAMSGIAPDVLVAAFGKAVGSQGACVLGSPDVRTWLWNRARSFVFSTAPSPSHVAALREQIARVRSAHGPRNQLAHLSERVRQGLRARGVSLVEGSFGPVVSIVVGPERTALALAERLRTHGILAQAIRPPTVPEGQSRTRLILRGSWQGAQADRLVEIVARETHEELNASA